MRDESHPGETLEDGTEVLSFFDAGFVIGQWEEAYAPQGLENMTEEEVREAAEGMEREAQEEFGDSLGGSEEVFDRLIELREARVEERKEREEKEGREKQSEQG